MSNPLYKQLHGNAPIDPMIQSLLDFKNRFNGDPKKLVQQLLDSGRISQAQVNQYTQQANDIFNRIKDLM